MAFNELENSNNAGSPIILYEFRRGKLAEYNSAVEAGNIFDQYASIDYRYTSHDRNVQLRQYQAVGPDNTVRSTATYVSTAISDQGISQTGESEADAFTIMLPSETAIVRAFLGTAPSDTVHLIVRRMHSGDTDAVVQWVGTVQGVSVNEVGQATITCQQLTVSFNRDGLHLSWERGCPHALYDHNCRVNKADFALNGTIKAVQGNTLEVDEVATKPTGWFSGGFLEYAISADPASVASRVLERRPIQLHDGKRIILLGLADGIQVGRELKLYPGCTRNVTTCIEKFNNLLNYGGVPFLPGKTPYDGDAVF